MKKALIITGAAIVLGSSRKEVTLMPCSNTLEVKFYNKGKVIKKEIWHDGNWYLSNANGIILERMPFTDSLSVNIVPVKAKP